MYNSYFESLQLTTQHVSKI